MSPLNKTVVSALIYLFLVHQVICDRDAGKSVKKDSVTKKHDDKDRHAKQHEDEFAHKLENAPIPSIHDGPKTFRSEEIGDFVRSRFRRHISQKDGLNPQRPHQKNEVQRREIQNGNDEASANNFHHPGHSSESTSNQPTNTYNYYKIANTYGYVFQYASNRTFKGYTETANIGIIPPRGANTNNYYNSISGLNQYPIITQQTNGLSQSLYGNMDYPMYGYGHHGRDYVKNAYKNVLTGLAMWSILNGLITGIRYTVYNHTNLPDEYSRNIILSNDTIVRCFDAATALCNSYTQPLCINNGTTFCVSSTAVSCNEKALGESCVDVPCDNCEHSQSTYLPCAANITVLTRALDKDKYNNTLEFLEESDDENVTLCATALIVPQKNNANRASCNGKLPCLENKIGNIIETTTAPGKRK